MAYTLQDSYTTDNSAFTIGGASWVAQCFAAGSNYTLTMVELPLSRTVDGVGNVNLAIRATAAGKPTGADLATASVLASTLGTDTTEEYFQFVLNTGVALTSGTVYALVISAPSMSSGQIRVSEDNAGGYAGGGEYASTDSGVTWSSDLGDDCDFKTYSDAGTTYVDMAGTLDGTGDITGSLDVTAFTDMGGTLVGSGSVSGGLVINIADTLFVKQWLVAVGTDELWYEDL